MISLVAVFKDIVPRYALCIICSVLKFANVINGIGRHKALNSRANMLPCAE